VVPDPVERVAAGLLILAVTLSQRIALANILLGLAALTWFTALARGSTQWRPARIYPPLLAWVVASGLAAAFSIDPVVGVASVWDLPTLILVPMMVSLIDDQRWDLMLRGLAAMAVLSSSVGLWQYLHGASDLEHRMRGLVSHYMTFSGWTLMIVLLLAADIVFNRPVRRRWTVPICLLCCLALALTYTRGTWVGCAVGVTFLVALWRPKAVLLVPVLGIAVTALAPTAIRQRAVSILDPGHPSNYDRLCMARAGLDMVADHPLTGIGLDMIKPSYEGYRVPGSIMERPPHLHSNPVQIAAERGLLGLAAYLWILVVFAVAVWPGLRPPDGRVSPAVAGAAAAVLGITVSGLFEYYWGDAEVWIPTLACLATPFALSRKGDS
jgi:O-antigen ligase